MNKEPRYIISVREDGLWNVIDTSTGGPVEVKVKGSFSILYKLTESDAKAWAWWLNGGEGFSTVH